MLKETETEETTGFVVTFLLLVAFQLGKGCYLLSSPMAKSMQNKGLVNSKTTKNLRPKKNLLKTSSTILSKRLKFFLKKTYGDLEWFGKRRRFFWYILIIQAKIFYRKSAKTPAKTAFCHKEQNKRYWQYLQDWSKFKRKNYLLNQNYIFHCSRCITPNRATSLRSPSPRHCAWATQLLLKKCRSGGEPLAKLCPIRPARDLNLKPNAVATEGQRGPCPLNNDFCPHFGLLIICLCWNISQPQYNRQYQKK